MDTTDHFDCPVCSRTSVMWDGGCGFFVCHHKDCASSFPPPEVDGSADEAVEALAGLGAVQRWLNSLAREEVTSRRLDEWANS